jgi:AhpD family alkylhydroperoxidase
MDDGPSAKLTHLPLPRTYRVSELARDLVRVAGRASALWSIWVGRRLSPAMREKVIVAVARVNACPMCEHAHSRMALDAGVTDAELAALEGMARDAIDRRTWLALAYARERVTADFDGAPDPETKRALDVELGPQATRDIEDVARVMTVANRIANTLKALSDRRRGRPVAESRLGDELVINALFLPGAWLGILVASARQRRSPKGLWRERFQS